MCLSGTAKLIFKKNYTIIDLLQIKPQKFLCSNKMPTTYTTNTKIGLNHVYAYLSILVNSK